jgi:hypothetical protein
MYPYQCLHFFMFPCHVYVSLFPCLRVHDCTFPELHKRNIELTESYNFHLFAANSKLPFVCCKRKWKMEVSFPWSQTKMVSAIVVSANLPFCVCVCIYIYIYIYGKRGPWAEDPLNILTQIIHLRDV